MNALPSGSPNGAMWHTPVSRTSPWNSMPFVASSARASATLATRSAIGPVFGPRNSLPIWVGSIRYRNAFSPSRNSGQLPCPVCSRPSMSRYQAVDRSRSVTGTDTKSVRSTCIELADRAFHLELDQPVHLDGVLERELLRDRLDEARHDHRRGLGLGEPARHEVEELLLADLRDGRLVADVDVALVDLDVRVGVRARLLVEDQRVAHDLRL